MTNSIPASVQYVIDANKQCEEIGKEIAAPIFAEGFSNISPENKILIIKLAQINMHLQERLLDWHENNRNFEFWHAMFKDINSNVDFLSIDPSGRLKEIATDMMANGDMEGYYKYVVEPMELNTTMVRISIEAQKMMIEDLNDL